MSAIYFNTIDKQVALRGSERAYAGTIVNDISLGVLTQMMRYNKDIVKFIPPGTFINPDGNNFIEEFRLWFSVDMGKSHLLLEEEKHNCWEVSLNTAMCIGNSQIQLLTRLHAQCEIHAYFLPDDFEYFCEVIESGLEMKIFRDGQGWDNVLDLFKTSKTPIVTSYSVCEGFPNGYICDWEDDNEGDDWYELPENEQWDMAFKALEKLPGLRVSRKPLLFGGNKSAFDFIAAR